MLLRFLYIFIVSIFVSISGEAFNCAVAVDPNDMDFMEAEYDDIDDIDDTGDIDEDSYEDIDENFNDGVVYADDTSTDIANSQNLTLNDGAGLVNVNDFDIAGIMLGMSFYDVYNLYHEQGNLYTLRKHGGLVYNIPEDWRYNLDYECRQTGVIQPNKLAKCIRGMAKSRGLLYVSEIHLERVCTGETVDVYLTSNATDNVVYRIVYTNDADKLEGQNQKFADQREKKILAFWKNVVKKYGAPNSGEDTWITSTNGYDPKMVAYYGALDLVDEGRHATDMAKAAKQSREYFRPKPYAF